MTGSCPVRRLSALHALAARLARSGQRAEIYIHGGACMVLVFNTRLTTRDVDAVFEPESADAPEE